MDSHISKICGLETEYGVIHRGSDFFNPVASSSMLINSYLNKLPGGEDAGANVEWDFGDETPGCDERFSERPSATPGEIETNLVNAVLTNGSRYYVDHAHPEFSGPECSNAREAVLYDQAGDLILRQSMAAAAEILPPGEEIVVYKNNSDGKGNSYGCHENYLVSRTTPFGRIVNAATAHFVTRQIYCGSGKVGCEASLDRNPPSYQITQRADFIESEVGLETTLKRPIINTRDEPHADARRYRRLHVIVGDANCSEVATFLKVGTTQFVLALAEVDQFPAALSFCSPVAELRAVSADLALNQPLRLQDGTSATALQIQWEIFECCAKYYENYGEYAVGDSAPEVLAAWERVLTQLETDPFQAHSTLDWVAKYRLLEAYRSKHGIASWGDARLQALDLQYHDLRRGRSLADRLSLEKIVSPEEVAYAAENPPQGTRAWFRGRCLQRFGKDVLAINWDSVVFKVGGELLRRIPMMEPLKGTKEQLQDLMEGCKTPSELINRLQQPERRSSSA